jgi:hypothetical protein
VRGSPWFDSALHLAHPRDLVRLLHRLSAIALCLAMLAGNAAVCAGWAITAEARMACCAKGMSCPMHPADSHDGGSSRVLTQAQADSCCASSERQQSPASDAVQTLSISPAVLGPSMVLPPTLPALIVSDGWRIVAPAPPPPVPKHVLLSVFLV